MAAHPTIRRARAFPELPGGLRAHPYHFTMETSALVAGPSLAPLRWEMKETFPLGLRALSFHCVKALGPLSDGHQPLGMGWDLPSPLAAGQLTSHTCVLDTSLT